MDWSGACCVSDLHEARRRGVDMSGIKFEHVSNVVNENSALQWLFGDGVVAYTVMREIIEDLECEKIAGRSDIGIPREYRLVEDFYVLSMAL